MTTPEDTARLKRVQVQAVVAAVLLAASLVGNWMLYKKLAESRALASRSFAVGYLSAQINALRDTLAVPDPSSVNMQIIKLQATSAQLGFPNPDTLKYYGIIPWEAYPLPSMSVAEHTNWTRRKTR